MSEPALRRPIEVSIDTRAAVTSLLRYSSAVSDWKVANQKIAISLYGWVLRNYESQGALVGGWAPLSRRTAAQKSKEGYSPKILLRTGVLKNNYAFFYNETEAGVGNRVSYSLFHEQGSAARGLPLRRQLPVENDAKEIVEKVLGVHLQSAADRSIR